MKETCASLILLALTLASCGGGGEPGLPRALRREARDLMLITIDTWRFDAAGFSGSGKVETPTLDALAAEAAVFPWTHAHAVVTLPSHASILTGLYPFRHGLHDNSGFVLGEGVPTLASYLGARGYETAAFVSAFPLDRRFGLHRGFDVYDDENVTRREQTLFLAERPAEQTVTLAKTWWDENRGRRRFLWVHLFTPHVPYEPPEPFATRYRKQPYYGEVALTDTQLRPLLDPMLSGQDAPTLVVLTSDHGESLGEHGESTHGTFAYESTLRVPLVLWAPGAVEPGIDERPARHVDLVPTILDLLAVETPPGLDGLSLFAPRGTSGEEGSYFEALTGYLGLGMAPLVGRIEGGMKAIRLPVPELYDLRADPGEWSNLAQRDAARLEEILSKLPADLLENARPGEVDPESIRKLRALGYVSAGGGSQDEPVLDASRDPKNMIPLREAMDDISVRYASGDAEGAARELRHLAIHYPGLTAVPKILGLIYYEQGMDSEAIEILTGLVSRGAADEASRRVLALSLWRAGQPKRAWDALAGESGSSSPETQCALGGIAAALERLDEARARLSRALELDPTFPEALLELGMLNVREGRFEEAEEPLERALAVKPGAAKAWNALGVARLRMGDPEGAVTAWSAAAVADPRYPDPLFNLAALMRTVGDKHRAIAALERYVTLVGGERRSRAQNLLDTLRREAEQSD